MENSFQENYHNQNLEWCNQLIIKVKKVIIYLFNKKITNSKISKMIGNQDFECF
jgi:hypothetical protein